MSKPQVDPVVAEINRVRIEAGMSQADLASRVGVRPNTVAQWFAGHRQPELRHVRQMALTLHLDLWVIDMQVSRSSREVQTGGTD